MKLFKIIKILFGALKLSLFREKLGTSYVEQYLAKYNIGYPSEWIGHVLLIIFFSVVSIGVSAEKHHLLYNNVLILNVYILSALIFFTVIIFSLLIKRFILPNISILIDRIPVPPQKTFFIKLIIETFDYKSIILITQIIFIPIFNYSYGLSNKIGDLLIVYFVALNVYFFACQISLLIKRVAYSRLAKLTFNKIRLITIMIAVPIYFVAKIIGPKIHILVSVYSFIIIIVILNFLFFMFLKQFELSK